MKYTNREEFRKLQQEKNTKEMLKFLTKICVVSGLSINSLVVFAIGVEAPTVFIPAMIIGGAAMVAAFLSIICD